MTVEYPAKISVTLTKTGRITIPEDAREFFGISHKDRLYYRLAQGKKEYYDVQQVNKDGSIKPPADMTLDLGIRGETVNLRLLGHTKEPTYVE